MGGHVVDQLPNEGGESCLWRHRSPKVVGSIAERRDLAAVDRSREFLAVGKMSVESARANAREPREVVEAQVVVTSLELVASGGHDRVAVPLGIRSEGFRV
jgi:hypothetical protein